MIDKVNVMKSFLLTLFMISQLVLLSFGEATAEDLIKVGWIGPLTGDAAVLGVDSVKVAQDVFAEANNAGGINGHKIKLYVEDDQYQTAKTISAYRKLVNFEGVKVIFVITYGGILAVPS
jgi:branched-chain amino acid transport system substrate-binding protein